jgi:hypothetical protein
MSEKSTSQKNRRRSDRRVLDTPVRMRFDVEAVEGISDNISRVGLMFFSDEDLRVSVEVRENGELQTYPGRLVRVQSLNDTTTGLAIEFDDLD